MCQRESKVSTASETCAASSSVYSETADRMLGQMITNVVAGAAGAAVGGNTGAFTASNADMYNRQLHPDEKEKLAQLQKGETADERQRLADAACYQVQCPAQMSDNDPAKAAELASQQRGARYITEQNELKATGLFVYKTPSSLRC